ncbi:MAG: hypothetical protein Q8909_05785, partial [Bacteroidota bacterium]|nr:hypothetical protein [Bacteroidota bacterium]
MKDQLNAIQSIIDKILIPTLKKQDDNIFNIGTSGYYENPFTEVMAYILSNQNKHPEHKKFV